MPHVEMVEIVLQGYMPEVERAPWSPDSWAPVSPAVRCRVEWGRSPRAVAGQREIGDKKGWETVKDGFALPH